MALEVDDSKEALLVNGFVVELEGDMSKDRDFVLGFAGQCCFDWGAFLERDMVVLEEGGRDEIPGGAAIDENVGGDVVQVCCEGNGWMERLGWMGGVVDGERCWWGRTRGFWCDHASRHPIIYWPLPFACRERLAAKTGQLLERCPRRRQLKHPPCWASRSRSSGVSFLGMGDRDGSASISMGVEVEGGACGVVVVQWCWTRLFGATVGR